MKNRSFMQIIRILAISCLLMISCQETDFTGDDFAWSPDGKKLAVVTLETNELLVVDIHNDRVENTRQVDNYIKILSPCWSFDSQYLLYSKSTKEYLNVYVYSTTVDTSTLIVHLPAGKDDKIEQFRPCWSPKENLILFTLSNASGAQQVYLTRPDGQEKKLLVKVNSEQLVPAWSPDGQWIVYSVFVHPGHQNNGLWKMKSNGAGPAQIYQANKISSFRWSPDGKQLVLAQLNDNNTNQLIMIDASSNHKQVIYSGEANITNVAWSPEGKNLCYVLQTPDEKKNAWMVEAATLKKFQLTFANVKEFYGWGQAGQVFFTIAKPEQLVDLTEAEKEKVDMFYFIRGMVKDNKLISIDNTKITRLADNVHSFRFCRQNGCAAFFQNFGVEFLTSLYCPIIILANGEPVYLARTQKEHLVAASQFYRQQKYHQALAHLNQYWNGNISKDFQSMFDVQSIISSAKITGDSSQYRALLQGQEDGALLTSILIMRQLKHKRTAEWLFDQYKILMIHYFESTRNSKENYNDILTFLIFTYARSRYEEFQSGIKDIDRLLTINQSDSLFKPYLLYAQALLAFEDSQYELGLNKVKLLLDKIPQDFDDLDDIKDMVYLQLPVAESGLEAKFIPVLQQLAQYQVDEDDIIEIHSILADLYEKTREPGKAMAAYQAVLNQDRDNNEIWDRVFRMEVAR